MKQQTKLRTDLLEPNQNISFPIGTILGVRDYYSKLRFSSIFGKYKKRGRDLNSLIQALLSYKLTENFSITRASDWINRPQVLEEFDLEPFEQRTLFRVLEILGRNHHQILAEIQNNLFEIYEFENTDVVFDWTSLVLHGDKCKLGKYGYSRDHRPDKKQITLGLSQLAEPVNIPIGMTIGPGNLNDTRHFRKTYKQVRRKLKRGSLVTFDKGAHSMENVELILNDQMQYLTAKKLNKSDDKRIETFFESGPVQIDKDDAVYGIKYAKPSRIDYFYYSGKLKREQLESRHRRALRKLEEAREIQNSLEKNRGLPKRFQVNNPLIDLKYSYQTKLDEMSEDEALELLDNYVQNGREGFFCIVSVKDLTLQEALATYRKKDSVEKLINSLKNEIEIKPLRVWSKKSICGALLIGYIAQLMISLIRYERVKTKNTSTKFIRQSLMNLTVTIESKPNGRKRRIYSNFDPLNQAILTPDLPFG